MRFSLVWRCKTTQQVKLLTEVLPYKQTNPDLLVDLPLQLHDLVLHPFVELLEVLHRAGLDLQLLQLAPGPHPADAALQVHDGAKAALVPAASQPAPGAFLNDHGLGLSQQLGREAIGGRSHLTPPLRLISS